MRNTKKIKKRDKKKADEKRESILHFTNEALVMCYKIRENGQRHGSTNGILEKLGAVGMKCEARLSLIMYKMNNAQNDYMRLHQELTGIMKQRDARFTPTSPVRSELREIPFSPKEFRKLNVYLSGNQWLLKAHDKWEKSNHEAAKNRVFFNIIGKLCEVKDLNLMCSLKDLSTYQVAAVKELRCQHMGTNDVSPMS